MGEREGDGGRSCDLAGVLSVIMSIPVDGHSAAVEVVSDDDGVCLILPCTGCDDLVEGEDKNIGIIVVADAAVHGVEVQGQDDGNFSSRSLLTA